MIEKIEWKGKTLALILRGTYDVEGVNFFTAPENPLQLGVLKHKQGTKIKAHIHKDSQKVIREVQEVLHIVSGKVEAEFYDSKGAQVSSTTLNTGDTIMLLTGGHGFNILEESKIIEVKQGPYLGHEEDKEIISD